MGKHGFLYGKVRKVFHIYDWVKNVPRKHM